MRAIRSNNNPWYHRRSKRMVGTHTRREFIRDVATYGAAAMTATRLGEILTAQVGGWRNPNRP
jgi:hypothetical protein